jgi:2-epi-5-epi-valiolone synthase
VGQIDAGIGLKTGVNFRTSKNFLGSFHPPEHVLVDPAFLVTLPARELRQGFAEMVKIALVRDLGLFTLLEKHGRQLLRSRFRAPVTEAELAIQRSIALMLDELAANPFENRSLERLVDMGHTFSPELESASGFTISHGDAVAIDLALTCALGVELGMLEEVSAIRVHLLLELLDLPTGHELLDVALCKRAIGSAALHRGGRLNLVMPTAIGAADFVRETEFVTDAVLEAALRRLRSLSPADSYSMAATRAQANWVAMMHLSP